MAKRNKHGRFIVTKQGLLLDTHGFGCRTWGMSNQKTIKFESGKYYLKEEYADTNGSYNYQGSLYIEQDLSAIGGSDYNQIVVRAIAWDNSKHIAFRPTIIPVEKQSSGGGKYSNHLHYDIHLEGTWDTSNQIMTFDTASQNAIKVVLDKLDELTVSENYDFLVNMRVAGKASAEGDIALIGANMKLNYVPGISNLGVVRNLQAQFIISGNSSDIANIVVSDTEFATNSQMFHSFMSIMYVVFQFDINY